MMDTLSDDSFRSISSHGSSGLRSPARSRSVNDYPAAVWGRNLQKTYGRGANKVHVLNGLNITVPRGSIYGLLGPSGCGKTTFLRITIGRLSYNSGHIIALGDKPAAKGHKVPGSAVGYMPQETALFPDLTISETLKYFGGLHGMTSELIRKRTDFLIDFFTLPSKDRLVGQLSGGQMRRVSFMVALLHEPELLIVDEPTVGVDPLLRERIWDHLVNISSHTQNQTTIILTTHYIEEARKADKVGFMRNGRILTEDKPTRILNQFHLNSLEKVFLQLCHKDITGTPADLTDPVEKLIHSGDHRPPGSVDADDDVPLLDSHLQSETTSSSEPCCNGCLSRFHMGLPSCGRIASQFVKNLRIMKRNKGFLLFQFLLPIVQIVLFSECVGNNPFGLRVAVINKDSGFLGMDLGQQFLGAIDNNTVSQVDYTNRTYEEAHQSVIYLKAWGILHIGGNFSEDLFLRFLKGNTSESVINGSSITLQMDASNQQVAVILQKTILDGFEKFASDMLSKLGMNPKIASLPIDITTPIYGHLDSSFTSFMAPGVIMCITFFLATGLTTLVFVGDKKSGMFDRCLASGMVSFEIMLAHMFTQMLIVIVQVAALLAFTLLVFHVECKGPLIWVVLLVLIQGFCGMSLGVLFAAMCDDENSAIQLSLGSFFPLLLMSGIMWPVEAIPMWLRYASFASPLTLACEAMRCILSRGLDITFTAVWQGYLVSGGWCVGLVIIGGIILKLKE